jgi:hypothetical protein
MVFRQQGRQIQPAKRGNAANAQAAADFSGGSRHFVLQPLRRFPHLTGMLDESLPGRSQRDLARRPFEQPGTELLLQPGNLVAQRRLHGMTALGGTGEVFLFGHRQHVINLAQVHSIHLVSR